MSRLLVALGIVGLLAGCGVDVEDVCEDLAESCSDVVESDCKRDGETVQQASEDLGCDDVFDTYLDCVDASSCDYDSACERERTELESCVELTEPD